MSAINLIKQGQSFTHSFDRDDESIAGWTCEIAVVRFPGKDISISRAVTPVSEKWKVLLTTTDTNGLAPGLHYLIATLTKTATNEQEIKKIRFSVGNKWGGGRLVNPVSPSSEETLSVNSIPVASTGLVFFDGWSAPKDMTITKIGIFALDAPVGQALNITVLKNGVEQSHVAVLSDGATHELTTFGTPLALSAGDRLGLKYTQVGTTSPGNGIIANINYLSSALSTPAAPAAEQVISVNSVPVATNGLVFFDGWSVPFSMTITKLGIYAVSEPTGDDLNITVVKNGIAQPQIGVLADGSNYQLTTFGTPLPLAAFDKLGLKYTKVGSTIPGNGVVANITYLKA